MHWSPPSLEDFKNKAHGHSFLAMSVRLTFDHETPIGVADRFINEPHFFLLESATEGPNHIARYSFLGFDPLWSYTFRIDDSTHKNPIQTLGEELSSKTLSSFWTNPKPDSDDLTGMGGAVGFFGFDTASRVEPSIGTPPPKKIKLPDAFFFIPKNFMIFDNLRKHLWVIRHCEVHNKSQNQLQDLFSEECAALSELIKKLHRAHSPSPLKLSSSPIHPRKMQDTHPGMEETFPKDSFLKATEKCLEYIRSGDIYQIQIGNRITLPTSARPFDIFRHLRTLNPSPYMFYFKFGEDHILGSSPEMMVNIQKTKSSDKNHLKIFQRPIAGTRKRSWDSERDQKMRLELMNSEKEQAEHMMLVDLSRNDIGRVASPGSVQVEELLSVEEYSHVFHMVSQVSGELAQDKTIYDALEYSFPNGTVCGAPKIRAMQIIYDLEPVSREHYAGSLAFFNFDGELKSTLLIRSIHVKNGCASTHASAGIVYDSIPEQEWLETRNKMAACLTAIAGTL